MKKLTGEIQKRVSEIIKRDGGWNWDSIQKETRIGAGNGMNLQIFLIAIGVIELEFDKKKGIYPITEKGKTYEVKLSEAK